MTTSSKSTATRERAAGRRPVLERAEAMRLAADEYQRVVDQLRSLSAADWSRPTDCPDWDVRALATHMLGMAEMAASLREQIRQNRKATRAGGVFLDALTALQVAERTDMTPRQIIDRFAEVGPRAARGRRRAPGLVRRRNMPAPQPVGPKPDSPQEAWTFGYLIDVILTRDPWMHRTDIAGATGAALLLTANHDGVLVDDVVKEWAGRHGQPCTLVLTGSAGGSWAFGAGGPTLQADAVQFCRGVSGRGETDGLLATEVPF